MRRAGLIIFVLLLVSFPAQLMMAENPTGSSSVPSGTGTTVNAQRAGTNITISALLDNGNFSGGYAPWAYEEWQGQADISGSYTSSSGQYYGTNPGAVYLRITGYSRTGEAGWTQPFTYTGTQDITRCLLTFRWKCYSYTNPGSSNYVMIYVEAPIGSGNWEQWFSRSFYSTTGWYFETVDLKQLLLDHGAGTYQFEADAHLTTNSYGGDVRAIYDDVQILVDYQVNYPPAGLSVTINNDAQYTNNRRVDLDLIASGADQMCFSNTTTPPASWETFSTTKQVSVPTGDGTKNIYFWAKNNYGTTGPVTDSIYYDGTKPPKPSPSSPTNGTATNNNAPTFSWTAVTDSGSGLNHYTLQYSKDPTFATSTTTIDALTSLSYTPSPLSDGRWYWHIRAVDNAGNLGDWSPTYYSDVSIDTVYCPGPTLTSPLSGTATSDSTPTLQWQPGEDPSPSSGIDSYTLQLDTSSAFDSGNLRTITGLTSTSYTVGSPLSAGTWYWRVRATDKAGNAGSYSTYWSIVVDLANPNKPTLSQPTNASKTSDNTPLFVWEAASDPSPSSGISNYTLQYSLDPNFLSGVTTQTIVGTSWTVQSGGELTNGLWYWRVRAVDKAGNTGSYSDVFNLLVDTVKPSTPSPMSPSGTTSDNTPDFRWGKSTDSGSGVKSYTLELDTSSSFNTNNRTTISGVPGNYTLPTPIGDATWFWHVRAVDNVDNAGDWSATWNLTVNTVVPGAPTLVAPSNGYVSGSSTLTLSWGSASCEFYILHVADNPDFADEATYFPLLNTSKVVHNLGEGNWYWRVVAHTGAIQNSSTTRSVIVDTQIPSTPSLQNPGNGEYTNDTTPILAWNAATDSTSGVANYTLQYSMDPNFINGVTTWPVIGTSFTFGSALSQGTWYWHVRAIDRAGNAGSYSSARSFVVDTSPPSITSFSATCGAYTNTLIVTLSISVTGASTIELRNEVGNWVEFPSASSIDWTLTAGDGLKRIYLRCLDEAGNVAYVTGSYISLTLDTVPPETGTPSSPSLDAVTNNNKTVLQWGPGLDTNGIAYYALQLDTSPLFNSPYLRSYSGLVGTTCVLNVSLVDGKWYWRVNATDRAGNQGSYSYSIWFTVDTSPPSKPSLSNPTDGSKSNLANPIFSWTLVSGAIRYHIQIARDTSFTDSLIDNSTITDRAFMIQNESVSLDASVFNPALDNKVTLESGTWYWRVEAFDAAANPSGFQSFRTLEIDRDPPSSPSLSSPSQSFITNNMYPGFQWSSVVDADNYWIQIDRSSAFDSGNIRTTTDLKSNGYSFPGILFDGVWYWHVLAIDPAGNPSNYSVTRILNIDTSGPNQPGYMTSPAVNPPTNDTTPTFLWGVATDPVVLGYSSGVANYTLWYSKDSNFVNNVTKVYGISSTSRRYDASALTDGKWYWLVFAVDRAGNIGFNATSYFIVDTIKPDPPDPSSLLPSDASEPIIKFPMTFTWDASSDANGIKGYVIQIDSLSSFNSSSLVTKTVGNVTQYDLEQQLANGKWYWRIAAVDAAGNRGNFSSSGTPFTVNIAGGGGLSPVMLIVAGGGTGGVLVLALLGYVFYRRAKIPFVIKKIDQSIKLINKGEIPRAVPMRTRTKLIKSMFDSNLAIMSKQLEEASIKKKKELEQAEKAAGKGPEMIASQIMTEPREAPAGVAAGESDVDLVARELERLESKDEQRRYDDTELIKREIDELEKGSKKKKKGDGS